MFSFVLILFSALPAQSMSMEFSTRALHVLRCLNDAKSVDDTVPCQRLMNEADDVLRSTAERQAFAAIAGYAAAKIQFMSDRDSILSDIRGKWSGEHVSPTAEDNRALEKQEHDYLLSPAVMRHFELESACGSELDEVLRAQSMKPLPKCLEYRGSH